MELNGNLYITNQDKQNIDVTGGSKAVLSTETDLMFIVHENGELKIESGGSTSMVIVNGGSIFVKGHVQNIELIDGIVSIDKGASIDIMNVTDWDHVMLCFMNGANPKEYKIVMHNPPSKKNILE